jgi:oligoribonuclease
MHQIAERLVWVDLEMTGLDSSSCTIVEIATLVTEADLTLVAEGPNLIVHQPEEALANMNDYVRDLHSRSGLLDAIRRSAISLEQAETETLDFLAEHTTQGTAVLAGNSIWKDREFLAAFMPRIIGFLHYRMIDVSTVKELVRRWYPSEYGAPNKQERHRALDDIRESVDELRWYREKVFAPLPAQR